MLEHALVEYGGDVPVIPTGMGETEYEWIGCFSPEAQGGGVNADVDAAECLFQPSFEQQGIDYPLANRVLVGFVELFGCCLWLCHIGS